MKPFSIIEHTADVGIEARGRTCEELFENAALGMFSIIGDVERVAPRETRDVRAEAEDVALLLAVFLGELLYLLEVDHFVSRRVEVHAVSDTSVCAAAYGEPLAPHHELYTEIKAVTHHGLSVERQNDTWRASVLFDI